MTRKICNNSDPGDSTHMGGNDTDYINNLFLGQDQSASDPVIMATTWQFKNQKCQFFNPASTFNYIVNTGAILSNRNITLPVLTADDTFVFANADQYIDGYDATPDIKKTFSIYTNGTNNLFFNGISNGTHNTAGTLTSAYDTTEGGVVGFATAASANVNAGVISTNSGIGIGRTLTSIFLKSRQAANATTSVRFYMGLTSANTLPISDTPLANTDSGVLVGYTSADTTWQTINNDGTGAMVKTQITGPINTDTAYHTIQISIPAGGASATVTLDNTSVVLNSRLPATTTNLFFNCVAQTTTTTARTLNLRYIRGAVDR